MLKMKMRWGSSGIDPLVFNDVVLVLGLPVAYSKNEPFQDFFKLTLDAPIISDNVLIETVIMNTFFRFHSWQGKENFSVLQNTTLTLWPTHLTIQWVPGNLFVWIKQLGCEVDHSSPSSSHFSTC